VAQLRAVLAPDDDTQSPHGKLIKSRKRGADHGEVSTGKREVNAMLDLVKQETENIESRFLEPACISGNFLTAIRERVRPMEANDD
jgi:hypothetical protein